MKKIFKIFSFLVLFSASVQAQSPVRHIPLFTFYRLNNKPFTKKDLTKSRKVFFVFFDSSCEHCQQAIQDIAMHYNRFKKTTICLVTLDNRKAIDYFMSKYGAGIADKPYVTILQDKRNEFISRFNPRKYPAMLLYSSKGNLIQYEDDDHQVSQIYDRL